MTIHFLDTSALINLLEKHNPPLFKVLKRAAEDDDEAILVPAPVLVELGQSQAPEGKRLESVIGPPVDLTVAKAVT